LLLLPLLLLRARATHEWKDGLDKACAQLVLPRQPPAL
jgi:hypothetical protein